MNDIANIVVTKHTKNRLVLHLYKLIVEQNLKNALNFMKVEIYTYIYGSASLYN